MLQTTPFISGHCGEWSIRSGQTVAASPAASSRYPARRANRRYTDTSVMVLHLFWNGIERMFELHAGGGRRGRLIRNRRLCGSRGWRVPEQVSGLALHHVADRFERREPHRACLTGLEDREIRECDADPLGELCERHPSGVEHVVEFHHDRHDQTVPSRSSRIRVPWLKTRASTNSNSTA